MLGWRRKDKADRVEQVRTRARNVRDILANHVEVRDRVHPLDQLENNLLSSFRKYRRREVLHFANIALSVQGYAEWFKHELLKRMCYRLSSQMKLAETESALYWF